MFKNKKDKKNKKESIDHSVIEIIPYESISSEGYLVMKNGDYQEWLKCRSVDLNSVNTKDADSLISYFSTFFRVVLFDIKFVSLKYKVSTKVQQQYWLKKYQTVDTLQLSDIHKEKQKRSILGEIETLQIAENNITNQEYYLVVNAKTKKELASRIKDIKIFGEQAFSPTTIATEKKKGILAKILNMNSL